MSEGGLEDFAWWPCCDCCDDPLAEDGPKSACCFNGRRDYHTWHCEDCGDPDAALEGNSAGDTGSVQ